MPSEPLVIQIDVASEAPAYRQIVDALRAHLVAGRLRPGDPLPPVRQLAADLGVHFNTVAESYRMLADEGWLELRRRTGARVLDRKAPEPAPTSEQQSLLRRMSELAAEALSRGVPADELSAYLHRLAKGIQGGQS